MSERIQALAQQITGKKSIDDCSLDELQHLVKRHPYYAPAQFLLLQKLRQSGTAEQAEVQYRKAVLFYHDPLLFEHFISSSRFYVEDVAVERPEILNADTIEEYRHEEKIILREGDESITAIVNAPIEVSNVVEGKNFEKETLSEESGTSQDSASLVGEENEIETVEVEESASSDFMKETQEYQGENEDSDLMSEAVVDEKHQEANSDDEEKQPAPTELAFEPFHTVDYFASQGIKITAEEAPKDKLGKQLKSFTEWLKTMKRLPASQISATAETTAEKKVETLASHSVSESNVVTEAMAEVWLKQGNTEKALDIYNKLSLLNPSKKAYFAAKIENLKLS